MDDQLAQPYRPLSSARSCSAVVRDARKLRSGAGAAVVAAFFSLFAAGCVAGSASPAITAVDRTTSAKSPTAHSTSVPSLPGGVVASSVASGAEANHPLQATTTAVTRSCDGRMSGFSASIAAGVSGAPTPLGALKVFLAAPYEPAYSAPLDQWQVKARSVHGVTYSAKAVNVTITELPDRTWIVTSGETCASADRPTTARSTTTSH